MLNMTQPKRINLTLPKDIYETMMNEFNFLGNSGSEIARNVIIVFLSEREFFKCKPKKVNE